MNPIPPPLKTKGIDNMKVISRKETAILTAQEKAILDKALEILDNIIDECEDTGDLWTYAEDAANELESFLNHGENSFYEVEPPVEGVSEVIVKITL